MINKLIPFLLSVAILFSSCDPEIILIIKKSHNSTASITFYSRKGMFPDHWYYNPSEKIIMHVPTDSAHRNKIVCPLGIGFWTNDLIEKVADNTDSIVLYNSTGKVTISNKEDIKKLLREHKRGRSAIKIKVK